MKNPCPWEIVEPVRVFLFYSDPERPQLPVFDCCISKKMRTIWNSPKESNENDQRLKKHDLRGKIARNGVV